jgi:hypothetical protein
MFGSCLAEIILTSKFLTYYFSGEESMSHWQQNDYKVLSPSVEDNPDFSKVPAIQV